EVRNRGDALVHATEKSLKDLGDKVPGDERARIESAIAELKDALKGDNKSTIETKLAALGEASASMAQRAYGAEGAAQGGGGAGGQQQPGGDDNVVDAEFEEVKDDEQKSA